ncbi:MAG: hypothetical protein KGO02_24800 [Alphaproteobacteria bacterium]|nr:hypothetical protein [Alphaproteobacteria bacterium]
MQGHRALQVRQLLGKAIGQARHAAHLNPHGEVGPLNMAGADPRHVGVACHDRL